jgi:hypothetical protein
MSQTGATKQNVFRGLYNKVSVSRLCRETNVNRGRTYLHQRQAGCKHLGKRRNDMTVLNELWLIGCVTTEQRTFPWTEGPFSPVNVFLPWPRSKPGEPGTPLVALITTSSSEL